MRLNSLAARLFISALVLALSILPLTAVILISLYRGVVEREFDARLGVHLTALAAARSRQIAAKATEQRPELSDPRFSLPFSGWYWQITPLQSSNGTRLISNSLLDAKLNLPRYAGVSADKNRTRKSYATGPENQRLRILERDITVGQDASAQTFSYAIAGDSADIDRTVAEFKTMLITALSILGLGLVIATLIQVRFGLAPLRAVQRGLAAIRSGKAERLEGAYPVEIMPLQQELNALIASNYDIIERARTHVGNLAHALKTPLSVMSNEARNADTPLAEKVREQTDIMRGQITHHLDRARVAARYGVIGGVTPVCETLEPLVRALSRIHADRHIDIELDCETGLAFQGEKQDFEEMVGNLLDNACKWAASRVELHVTKPAKSVRTGGQHGHITIIVDDDGPGLTPEKRKAAVARGKRLDETKPGSGLGLSIVADLANLYKGGFTLRDSPLGGLRAQLDLPTN